MVGKESIEVSRNPEERSAGLLLPVVQPNKVTIHCPISRETLEQMEERRVMEEQHAAAFLMRALNTHRDVNVCRL